MARWLGLLVLVGVLGLVGCGDEPGGSSPGSQDGGNGGGPGQGGDGGSAGAGGSGGAGGQGGNGGNGGSGGGGGTELPTVRVYSPRLAGIVDADVADSVREKLRQNPEADLIHALELFYDVFPDEFDFVFFFTEVEGSSASGIHTPMNRPAIPGTGIDSAYSNPRSPSSTLRSAISLRLGSNGPTLHEVLHYWAVNLSTDLGFYRSHWQYAGVNGQLGGFDPDTLYCQTPAGTRPPCTPEGDGTTIYVVDHFGGIANGGDSVPYAPLELYLMGLIPSEEVPPTPIFVDVVEDELVEGIRIIRAQELRIVEIEDIIAEHGARTLKTEDERAFRAAFVLVTEEEPTTAQIEMADKWVAMFGCHDPERWLYCFEEATDGLATMDVILPPTD